MDKLTKVRAEVERLHNEYRNKKGSLYFRKALRTVLFIIDSLQEEPVSEDFEIALEKKVREEQDWTYIEEEGGEVPMNVEFSAYDLEKFARWGANWQKEQILDCNTTLQRTFELGKQEMKQQMMAEAVDGVITFDYYGNGDKTYGCVAHDSFCLEDFGLKDKDKVKVIVIKDE